MPRSPHRMPLRHAPGTEDEVEAVGCYTAGMSWDHLSDLNDGRHIVFAYCAGKEPTAPAKTAARHATIAQNWTWRR